MSKRTQQEEIGECDLCGRKKTPGYDFTEIEVYCARDMNIRNLQKFERHICEDCKACLLGVWNARCIEDLPEPLPWLDAPDKAGAWYFYDPQHEDSFLEHIYEVRAGVFASGDDVGEQLYSIRDHKGKWQFIPKPAPPSKGRQEHEKT